MFYCAGSGGGGIECVAPMLSAFTERRNFVRNGLNDTKGIQCGDIQGAFYAFADASEAITRLHKDGIIDETTDLSFCAYLLEKAEIAAVPGSAFGIDNHFRISFAAADDLLKEYKKHWCKLEYLSFLAAHFFQNILYTRFNICIHSI